MKLTKNRQKSLFKFWTFVSEPLLKTVEKPCALVLNIRVGKRQLKKFPLSQLFAVLSVEFNSTKRSVCNVITKVSPLPVQSKNKQAQRIFGTKFCFKTQSYLHKGRLRISWPFNWKGLPKTWEYTAWCWAWHLTFSIAVTNTNQHQYQFVK